MTVEKWVTEEKMRLERFKICCVNAQKEERKSFPLKMPRSCWSGQYRTWDDSLDALSLRSCHPQHAIVGKINSGVSKYWHEWRNKGYQMEEPPRISADW
jgi:hypothetical protein